jgi:gamma-polyglutamate biosynthesis protein CapC
MGILPLPIFPEGGLRDSVVTTVWIGVFVISSFNLRFGWTYSGLVIPGYLVPLILTSPVSAGITIVEGMLAYGLVWLVSERLSQLGWWCNFFGRDRFFALLLSAVLIRVTLDGWCLPALGTYLQQQWNLTFDYKGMFHSFGLIIVALIANQFWKTGFRKGLVPFGTTLGVTFIIVRFGLMTLTNFNLGHMTYLYSNTAASLMASPKSYIILLVTGLVASRMNLRYGWEYNGILIPALLALQWYEPLKIVSSLCEAAVVYIVSDRLLESPLFRGTTMEGARKLLLFFNVAYAYRFVLGYVLPWISPGIVVNDYYGFAYLLSSLIALKMHSKHIVLRLARATLQTSLAAAVAANLVGLWLASMLGSLATPSHPPGPTPAALNISNEPMEVLAAREKVRLYRQRTPDSVVLPTPGDLNRFGQALEQIQKYTQNRVEKHLHLARRYLHELKFEAELLEGRYLCLREQEPARGWGLYIMDLNQPRGLLVEVPAPLEEWSVAEAALRLYRGLGGSMLAIAGGARLANRDGSADVLANPHTPFQTFHRVFNRRNVLEVRGYADEAPPRQVEVSENRLYVKHELPRSLGLKELEREIGKFQVVWTPAPAGNVQQRETRSGFAELWLTRTSRIQLKGELTRSLSPFTEPAVPEDALIMGWLLDQKQIMARSGGNDYIQARPEEMLFFDEEILTPLLELAHKGYRLGRLTRQGRELLRAINASACLMGYEVCFRHDVSRNQDFLVLAEPGPADGRRYWGTFVLRLGESQGYAVQVPRPLFDINSLECGVHLFDRLEAESLLVAGSHNEANQDQASDVLNFRNTANLFTLVNQVVMRQAKTETRMAVQCRGFGLVPGMEAPEVLVAFQDGIRSQGLLTELGRKLTDCLRSDGLRMQFVDGSPIAAGYEISCVPQAQYLNASTQKEFAILWLSPILRDVFRPQDEAYPLQVQLKALNIPITVADLGTCLKDRLRSRRKTVLPAELKSVLDHYVMTLDIVALQQAQQEWPDFRLEGFLDRNSRQLVLMLSRDPGDVPVVLNLRPRQAELPAAEPADESERIELFLASRTPWLEWPL